MDWSLTAVPPFAQVFVSEPRTFPDTAHIVAQRLARTEGQRTFDCLIAELRAECDDVLLSPEESVQKIAGSLQRSEGKPVPCFTKLQVLWVCITRLRVWGGE